MPSDPTDSISPAWERAVLLGAIAAAVVSVVVSTGRYGMGVTSDSVAYFDGARAIAEGRGYTDNLGGPILGWPPGYPAALALVGRLGLGLDAAARIVSVVGYAVTVLLTYVLLRRHVRSPAVRAGGTIVVGCSAVLLEVYSKALSEHLFLPAILLFVLVGEELMDRPTDNRLLGAAIALTWTAFYLRYAGVVLVGVGALVLVIANRARPGTALTRTTVFVLTAVVVPALWLTRNVVAAGEPMGPRAPAASSPALNIFRVTRELSRWIGTDLAGRPLTVAVYVCGAVALGALGWLALRRPDLRPRDLSHLVPLVVMVIVYLVYLFAAASLVAFAAIDSRFVVPVFAPAVVLGAWLFEQVRDRLGSWRTALTVAGVAWVALNVAWFAGSAIDHAREGAGGFATERWHESEILVDAARLDFSVPTYSNNKRAISLFLGEPAWRTPARTYYASDQETPQLSGFVRRVACAGQAQLVWFVPHHAKHLYDLDDLRAEVVLEPVVERSDGTIFTVRPRADSAFECS